MAKAKEPAKKRGRPTTKKVEVKKEKPKGKYIPTGEGTPPPPAEYRFKPGQSGNPLGGQLHDPVGKMFKNLTKQELIEVGNLVIKGSVKELRAMKDNEDQTVLKRMLAAVCVKVISKGDMQALDALLNRLIGKVKDDVTVTSVNKGESRVVVSLPNNNRDAGKSK